MKLLALLCLLTTTFFACNKNDNSTDSIAPEDITASTTMTARVSDMSLSLNNLIAAPNHSQRLYWDSAFHHQDSVFWHHHNIYHHSTYTHDDHSHQWVPYDPSISHLGHHHPPYPGHLNDSLVVTVNNNHPHTNCDHHPGHHICHHHSIHALHQLHHLHHP